MLLSGVLYIRPVPHFKERAGGQCSFPPPQIHSLTADSSVSVNACVSRSDSPWAPLAFHSDGFLLSRPFCLGGWIKKDMKVQAAAFVWVSVTVYLSLMPDKKSGSMRCVNPPSHQPSSSSTALYHITFNQNDSAKPYFSTPQSSYGAGLKLFLCSGVIPAFPRQHA